MLKFGILGAAWIAPMALIEPCAKTDQAEVRLIAARDKNRAIKYAKEHHIPIVANSYKEVIEHPDIDAVYIPLPISEHRYWTLTALAAGKHVLCEKSFASNAAEARQMADMASSTGLILMDAFHYRYHPLFSRAIEIYRSGILGDITEILAQFNSPMREANDIRMIYATGGGVTIDMGCYPLSWVRHLTGEEPIQVKAEAEVGPADVDIYLRSQLQFENGLQAITVGDMRVVCEQTNSINVVGSLGEMFVENPLSPQSGSRIEIRTADGTEVERFATRPSYEYQLDAFIQAVASGEQPITGPEDAVRQMQLIDRCYQAAGLPLRGHGPK